MERKLDGGIISLEILPITYENIEQFLETITGHPKANTLIPMLHNQPSRALDFMGEISAFKGSYIWTPKKIRARKRRDKPDLSLVCRAMLPTEPEQIQINAMELYRQGLAATRALVLDYPHETPDKGRRIWFTKEPGKHRIYTKQNFCVEESSGKRTILLL